MWLQPYATPCFTSCKKKLTCNYYGCRMEKGQEDKSLLSSFVASRGGFFRYEGQKDAEEAGRQRIKNKGKLLISGTAVLVIAGLVFGGFMLLKNILPAAGEDGRAQNPEELLCYYMAEIEQDKYEEMYDMLEPQSQESISHVRHLQSGTNHLSGNRRGGNPCGGYRSGEWQPGGDRFLRYQYEYVRRRNLFFNKVVFLKNQLEKGEEGYPYLLVWDDSLIFPELQQRDKVKVTGMTRRGGKSWIAAAGCWPEKALALPSGLYGKMEKNEESDDIFGEETVTDEEPAGNEETPVNEETAANESSDVNEETSSKVSKQVPKQKIRKQSRKKISSPSVWCVWPELFGGLSESIEKAVSQMGKDGSFVPH